jgi:hypothetical protein
MSLDNDVVNKVLEVAVQFDQQHQPCFSAADIANATGFQQGEVELALEELRARDILGRPYGCNFCDFTTPTAADVARHTFMTHQDLVAVTCEFCDINIVGRERIFGHMRDVHPHLWPASSR